MAGLMLGLAERQPRTGAHRGLILELRFLDTARRQFGSFLRGVGMGSSDWYPILDVALHPFSRSDAPIGKGKGKVWVSHNGEDWLFKFPRTGHGEHWAEKISSELASLLEIDFPEVELARCAGISLELAAIPGRPRRSDKSLLGRYGALVRSFSPPSLKEGGPIERSFHIGDGVGKILGDYNPNESSYIRLSGADVLALNLGDYTSDNDGRTASHNVKDVVRAWADLTGVGSLNPAPLWDVALEQLASYILLAALVCNTDRNWTNWEIMRMVDSGDVRVFPSPTFDYGSSLGRELNDDQRLSCLNSGGLARYLLTRRGGLYVSGSRETPLPPVRLAALLCRWRPRFTEEMVRRIESLSDSQIWSVIDKVPAAVITDVSKRFAGEVVLAGREMLSRRGRVS